MPVLYKKVINDWISTDVTYRHNGINAKHTPFVIVKYTPKKRLMKIKMKQINLQISSIMYRNDNVTVSDVYDTGKGECVIDALVKIYNDPDQTNTKRRIKKCTRDNIIKLLQEFHDDINKITKHNKPFNITDGIDCDQYYISIIE